LTEGCVQPDHEPLDICAPRFAPDLVAACAKASVSSRRSNYIFNPTTGEIRRGDTCVLAQRAQARLLTKLLIADGDVVPIREVMAICGRNTGQPVGKGGKAQVIKALRSILEPLGMRVNVMTGRGCWLSGPIQLCDPSELVHTLDALR
jgi:hypothetical protein